MELGVFVVGVVDYEVEKYFDVLFMIVIDQSFSIFDRFVWFMNILIVGDIIVYVMLWVFKDG